jgi:hypothetical protein
MRHRRFVDELELVDVSTRASTKVSTSTWGWFVNEREHVGVEERSLTEIIVNERSVR